MDGTKNIENPTDVRSVERVAQDCFGECLCVLKRASHDDPFTNWLCKDEHVRDRYLRYVLTSGFRTGWVSLARPRVGVCIASQGMTTADPCVYWSWLRFRHVVPENRWSILQHVSASIPDALDRRSTYIWYLGILRRLRGSSLAWRLLAQTLSGENTSSVLLHTAKPAMISLLRRAGAEPISRTMLRPRALSLVLYRLQEKQLRSLRRLTADGAQRTITGQGYL